MLRELQSSIGAALLGGSEEATAAVLGDGLAVDARLAIYRHHVFATLTDVLKATYPVVCRLVDERFFGYAADQYIRRHPPAGPCLFEYGDTFPDFLATFAPCHDLTYLPDVARLEWAMNVAEHACDFVPLEGRALRGLVSTDSPRLTFTFDPSLTLLESPWPIDRIWQANQSAAVVTSVNLAAGGARLEVRRVRDDVVFRPLGTATWAFRRALIEGRTLEEAAAAAFALRPAFDLTGAVRGLFEEDVLATFTRSPLEEKRS